MIPLATLREWFEYNWWARDRQLEVCSQVSLEQWLRPLGNSFPSLRDTLAHMAGAEWLWLERCQGRSPEALPAATGFPTLASTAKQWSITELAFREFLSGLDERALLLPVTYTGFTGETWSYPLWRVLMHLMNHQAYHRGQVTMQLRLLGAEPKPVDVLVAQDAGLFGQVEAPLPEKARQAPPSGVELARRLERAEAVAGARFVEARARLFPDSGARWIEVAGAYAMFDGTRSPVTQTFGLGLFQMPAASDMDELETFFRDRGAPVCHEISPLASKSVLPMLNARGYRPLELTDVMFLPLEERPVPETRNPAIRVRLAGEDQQDLWARTTAEGWRELTEISDLMVDLMRVFAGRRDALNFLAECEGRPIAAGSLAIHARVALLAGASTIPEWRNRGAHQALFQSRLEYAARAGCELAMICAEPGSASQRNAERYGFRVAYTRIKWGLEAGPDVSLRPSSSES